MGQWWEGPVGAALPSANELTKRLTDLTQEAVRVGGDALEATTRTGQSVGSAAATGLGGAIHRAEEALRNVSSAGAAHGRQAADAEQAAAEAARERAATQNRLDEEVVRGDLAVRKAEILADLERYKTACDTEIKHRRIEAEERSKQLEREIARLRLERDITLARIRGSTARSKYFWTCVGALFGGAGVEAIKWIAR